MVWLKPLCTLMGTVQPQLSGPHLSGSSIIRTLSSPAMYLCACVEGVTFCIQWVWLMLNEGARYVCGVKMLEMTNEDASKNPFRGLLMLFHTKAYLKRREKQALQLSGLFHLSGITAWVPWTKVSG